jgi:hypothetical protein
MTAQTGASRFVEAFQNFLADTAVKDDSLMPFIEALQGTAAAPAGDGVDDHDYPLLARLDEALKGAQGEPDLVTAVIELATTGGWYPAYTGTDNNAAGADFMLVKQVVGSKGLLVDESIKAGIFLLAPHFEYLMHDHAALEIYYVHSGTVDIQNGTDSARRRFAPGQYSVTPSEIPHALRTGDVPVIILFIWTGKVTAPIWWWVEGKDGVWTKTLAKMP